MGQTFQEVGDRDAEYVRWALGQVSPFGQIARFHDYLLNKPSRLDMPEAPREDRMSPELRVLHLQLCEAK